MGLAYNSAFATSFPVFVSGGGGGGGEGGGGGGEEGGSTPEVPVIVDDGSGGFVIDPGGSSLPVTSNPGVPVPPYLLSRIAFNRAPALAVYDPDGALTSEAVQVSGTTLTLRDGSTIFAVPYVGRSIKEIVEDINAVSQRFHAVELNQTPVLETGGLFKIISDTTPDGGQVVRLHGHAIKYQEETRLRLLMPYPDERTQPWYARIDTGQVLKKINGMRHIFSVPEYSDQPWSAYYGKPYVTMTDVSVAKINRRILQVPRSPIYWWDNNIVLTVNEVPQDSSIVEDVDQENGLVYLNRDIEPSDPVRITYTYHEKSFVYKAIDLNPSPDHLPQFIGQFVVFFLRPQSDSVGRTWERTVFHSIAPTLEGAVSQIPVKDDEPVILLGALQVRQANTVDDVDLVDTRTRGGGLHDDHVARAVKLNRAMQAVSDQGTYDGIPYPGNAVVIIELPESVLDSLTKEEIYERLKREMAFGVVPLVHFRDE